jgi:hypothetical protein
LPAWDAVHPYVRTKNVDTQNASAKFTTDEQVYARFKQTNVRRCARMYANSSRHGMTRRSKRLAGSRTVSMRSATASPGNPAMRNTDCQGRISPITGSVIMPSALISPTIAAPMKYASPAPKKMPIRNTPIARFSRSRGK